MAIPQIRSVGSSSGTVNNLGRNNLVIGETVTLSDINAANTGFPHSWALVDRPIGSSSTLTTPAAATSTFIPDVTGTYFVRCTVSGVFVREVMIAVPLARTAARIPAFTEALQYDGGSNTKGWHEALTAFMRTADAAFVGVGGQIGGTATSPTVLGLRETSGPTLLTMAGVADGKVLARSGTTIVGVNGGHVIESALSVLATRAALNFTGAVGATDAGAGPDRIDVDLVATAVTPGSYTLSSLTVDQKGRLTAAASASVNTVTDALLRQSAARSLIGRSANSTGNVADIAGAGADTFLGDDGTSLAFRTAYAEVQAAGSAVTRRAKLNFDADFTTADNGGSTRTDVSLVVQGAVTPGAYSSANVTVNSKGVVTAIANSSPVAILGQPLTWSPVDVAAGGFAATSNVAGSATTATMFYTNKAMSCTGVRFYWKRDTTDRTITIDFWSVTGSGVTGANQATATVNVTATGVYTGTFSSPVAIAANTRFMVSCFNASESTAGLHSVALTFDTCLLGGVNNPSPMVMAGPYLMLLSYRRNGGGGNIFPTASSSGASDFYYPVEPILDPIVL